MPRITQETFDAVVKENQDDFGMELQEAIDDAIEQFKSQGVDLSMIVTEVATDEAGNVVEHAVVTHLRELKGLLASEALPVADVKAALESLVSDMVDQAGRTLGANNDGYPTLVKACARCHSEAKGDGLLEALNALASILEGQPDLITPPNPDSVIGEVAENPVAAQLCGYLTQYKDRRDILLALMTAFQHGCLLHETNRQTFVANNIISHLVELLAANKGDEALVVQITILLRMLTLDDDVRVAFGKAHEHAKLIAKEHGGLEVLVRALEQQQESADAAAQLCNTLGRLSVRSEYCQEIVDLGGLQLIVSALTTHEKSAALAQAGSTALAKIAGNDDVKTAIRESGGISLILSVMQAHPKRAGVLEQGCAAVAALCLRCPTNATAVAAESGPHIIVKAMHMHPDHAKLQTTACRALRNIVVRNKELTEAILGESAEHYINLAMTTHQEAHDDAKAALRDLGCKVTLVERWKGAPRDTTSEIENKSAFKAVYD